MSQGRCFSGVGSLADNNVFGYSRIKAFLPRPFVFVIKGILRSCSRMAGHKIWFLFLAFHNCDSGLAGSKQPIFANPNVCKYRLHEFLYVWNVGARNSSSKPRNNLEVGFNTS